MQLLPSVMIPLPLFVDPVPPRVLTPPFSMNLLRFTHDCLKSRHTIHNPETYDYPYTLLSSILHHSGGTPRSHIITPSPVSHATGSGITNHTTHRNSYSHQTPTHIQKPLVLPSPSCTRKKPHSKIQVKERGRKKL